MKKIIAFLSLLSVNGLRCQQPAEQSVKPVAKIGAFAAAATNRRGTPERPALSPLAENPQSPERPLSSLAKRNGSPANKPQAPAASPFTPLELAQPIDVQTLGVPTSSAPASPQSQSALASVVMPSSMEQGTIGASAAAAAGAAARRYQAPQHATIYVHEDDEEHPHENPRALAQAEAAAEYRGSQGNLQIPVSPMNAQASEGSLHYADHFVAGSASRSILPPASPQGANNGRASAIRGSLNNGKQQGNGHSQISGAGQGQLIASVPGHPEGLPEMKPALVESVATRDARKEKEILNKVEIQMKFDDELTAIMNSMIENLRRPSNKIQKAALTLKKTINQLIEDLFKKKYTDLVNKYRTEDKVHVLEKSKEMQQKKQNELWKEILDNAAKQECCVIL